MADIWLTYAAAASALGMTPESVRQRARREGWRKQPGNDGRALILVPADTGRTPPGDTAGDTPGDTAATRPVKWPDTDTALAALRARLAEMEARTVELRADVERERTERLHKRERAEREAERAAGLAAEAAAAAVLRETVEALKAALEAERERGGELRRERDRAQLPLLRQLWLALAGGSASGCACDVTDVGNDLTRSLPRDEARKSPSEYALRAAPEPARILRTA